ncbi:hypothetical protein P171DRAFT_95458 [Karstenula rhodostoma CBS 690.94]|uniref:Uncharacterized protein n=1 Tax=Karstenula rhodostoma CBS 690.94 TaxID=1392251 RepID=A0A9P4U9R5_9PLEO|nr:hypothetical protein P171DRAFT_95458 [Karstenula rhodostoma CBS 690.94]
MLRPHRVHDTSGHPPTRTAPVHTAGHDTTRRDTTRHDTHCESPGVEARGSTGRSVVETRCAWVVCVSAHACCTGLSCSSRLYRTTPVNRHGQKGRERGHVRPIIALSPTARKQEETAPKIRRVCSPLHGRFSFSWNLTLPVGSGCLEPKMLFCECDRICVVHEGTQQLAGARVL